MTSQPTVSAAGISVVVPAYRSPATLQRLCDELHRHVEPLAAEFEIVFVDDGSGDDTWPTIQAIAAVDPTVRGISLLRNFGQHNALLAGLRHARFPIVVTMDDDLQNPPSEVPRLIEALGDDVDLVYGFPREEQQTMSRNLASRLTKRAMSAALGSDVYPRSSAFRAFRRELVAAGDDVHDPYISIDVLLNWATNRVTDVPVEFAPRAGGTSGYDFRRLVRHALNMITGYSVRPLRIASMVGVVAATFGFVMLAYVLARYVLGDTDVAGFTFLAAAITLFSGVQLLSLGLIGEYLGRIHFRSMGKPAYVVRAETGLRQADPSIDGEAGASGHP